MMQVTFKLFQLKRNTVLCSAW